jgi:hypothetical protein
MYVFSSANAIAKYVLADELISGRKIEQRRWRRDVFLNQQAHTSENIDLEIEHAVEHGADCAAGSALFWSARRESRLHPNGRRLEPRTFVTQRNW